MQLGRTVAFLEGAGSVGVGGGGMQQQQQLLVVNTIKLCVSFKSYAYQIKNKEEMKAQQGVRAVTRVQKKDKLSYA
jgi:hypothetical protein